MASQTLLTTPARTQRRWSGPENPQLPNRPMLRNNQNPLPLPKKKSGGRRGENPRNTPNPCPTPLPLRTKPIASVHKAGEGWTKERPGHTRQGAFLSFPKQNCPLLKHSCCSDVEGGGGCATNLKTKDRPCRGREARSWPLLPCTLPGCLNARRSPARSWQLSVIIPATPRAPAPGSMSRAGERHLPGSDKMPVFVPAAASRPHRPQGSMAGLPPSQKWFFNAQPGFLLSPQGLKAQSLPGIYHRGGALLKNTWSPFTEIAKGTESMFLQDGGGGVHRVGYTQENRAHRHTSQGLIFRKVFN